MSSRIAHLIAIHTLFLVYLDDLLIASAKYPTVLVAVGVRVRVVNPLRVREFARFHTDIPDADLIAKTERVGVGLIAASPLYLDNDYT